jgi:hypothetical protein
MRLRTRALTLLLVLAPVCFAGGESERVPRVIHRSFLGGAAALQSATQDPASGFKAHWLASCRVRRGTSLRGRGGAGRACVHG